MIPSAPPLSSSTRLAIFGLGLTQIIGWGSTYYLLALLGTPIARSLHLPMSVVLAGVSITLLASAFLGPWVGRLQDRRGSRLVMSMGSLILAAGLALLAMAQGLLGYFLAWIVIGIGTSMALYNAAFTAMTQMAGKEARRAITFLTFMGGLASTLFWPLSAFLLEYFDWRQVTLIYAALNLAVCLPIHALLLERHARVDGADDAPASLEASVAVPAQGLAFILLAAMLAINGFIFNAWSQLAFPILGGLGFAPAIAVSVASLVGVFQVAGRMGDMALGGHYSAFWTGMVSALFLPLAFVALFASAGALAGGLAFALLFGVSNGLLTIARGALTLAIFGARGYGERLGKVTMPQGVLGAIAPVLGAWWLDLSNAPVFVLTLLAISSLSLAAMWLLTRHCRAHPVLAPPFS